MRVTLSILAVLVVAAAGANAGELLTDGSFDTPITVLSYEPAPAPLLSTLTPGTWYTARKGWDQSWSNQVDGTNGVLKYGQPYNQYGQEAAQFMPIPAAGTGYTYKFDYRCTSKPQWGAGFSIRLLGETDGIYQEFFSTPRSEVGVYGEDLDGDAPTWTTRTYTFDITADQVATYKYLMVVFHGDGSGATGPTDLLIDNVSLKTPSAGLHPGDANGDGMVDVGDLGILGFNYGVTSGATWGMADFTGEGAVDVGDLGILGFNYGFGVPTGAVPEPATLSLLALGVVGLIRRKR